MYRSTKLFEGYSIAIRQWKARHSHCKFLHGYAVKFKVTFEPIDGTLDEMDWVQDFGSFKHNGLKDWMDSMFDHTTLIAADDPMRGYFEMMATEMIADVVFLPRLGAEYMAEMVYRKFTDTLSKQEGGRVKVVSVECFENDTNSAIYSE